MIDFSAIHHSILGDCGKALRSRSHGVALVVTLAASALGVAQGSAQTLETSAMAVSVIAVRPHCFHDRLTASGTFVPKQEVELWAPRDGFMVSDVLVDPGDSVTTDQVLAHLVPVPGTQQDNIAIRAPVNGTILAVSAPVGSYASSTTGPSMFRMASDAGLELKADILASRLGRLKVGMPARLHVVGLGELDGQVSSIGTAIDATTQFGSVSLTVADPRLRAGAFARAEIDAGNDCGLIIPLSALLSGPDGEVVGIVRGDRVEMRRVKTGVLEAGDVEVREGLSENDTVIARAGAFLREGDRVRSVAAPEAVAR